MKINCVSCGKELRSILTTRQEGELTQLYNIPLRMASPCTAAFETDERWVGSSMEESERWKTIECPYCHHYPFAAHKLSRAAVVLVAVALEGGSMKGDDSLC